MDHSAKRLHPCSTLLGFCKGVCQLEELPWYEEVECKRQGDSKVMAWCRMVDGRMLAVGWMVDENGRPHSVTSQRYQEMLQQHVWPEAWNQSSRQNYWFMQDGATSHKTELNINFLIKKFCGRVISRQSPLGHNWPPYILGLNPLDYFVWGFMRTRNQPELIPEQQQAVTDVAATIPIEKLRDAAKMCANAPGAVSRLPVAIVSISFSQCKNADSKLFSSIFWVTIQWKLSKIFRFLTLQLAC